MAAKRFFDESDSDQDSPNQRRRPAKPSLATAIGEVVKINFVQNFCSALEPMLRRVVNEEVESGLRRRAPFYSRSPSLRIKAFEPSTMELKFKKPLTLPIFTGTKIVDEDGNPLEIFLIDTSNNQMFATTISSLIKLEIVVVDGDFPSTDHNLWTKEEFEKNIVKERRGKRPLLAGDVNVTMRDGVVTVGDIELTDNSSWIRSRKFRIAARVVQGTIEGLRIREAMTEAFVVKDHRGELYKKHHPPMLEDEVWRLEKIGKDGAFHKKLASNGVHTVQQFLKLSVVNESKLRKILGVGMSEKMWEVTIKHARTCVLGNKLYISRGPNYSLFLNPICQVVKAVINGETFTSRALTSVNRAYITNMVTEAYQNWNSLEEVDGVLNETPLLTQGDLVDQYANNNAITTGVYENQVFSSSQTTELAFVSSNDHVGIVGSTYFYAPVEAAEPYNFSESSSEGELAATRPFIDS